MSSFSNTGDCPAGFAGTVNVVFTVPFAGTVTLFTTLVPKMTRAVEPATQPGPEVTETTVPTGPEVGTRVTGGATATHVSVSACASSATPANTRNWPFPASHTT